MMAYLSWTIFDPKKSISGLLFLGLFINAPSNHVGLISRDLPTTCSIRCGNAYVDLLHHCLLLLTYFI